MTPYYDEGGITIYHGNCLEILPKIRPDIPNIVITDQPYGTGWLRGGLNDPNGGPHPFLRRRDTAEWDAFNLDWMSLVSCPIISFCPVQGLWEMGRRLNPCLVLRYRKTNPAPYGAVVEPILCSADWKGPSFEWTGYNSDNVFHPCQKPIGLMHWLVRGATSLGDVVLDPFMGSGTTLRAAKDLGLKAIGIELSEDYCALAAKRLAQEVLPLS